jgi:L-seryl-tRNA(Ser) seleniumtransferase
MSFYEKMGLTPLINASETYTNLGGSLMAEETLGAMREAGHGFVDMKLLTDAVCRRAALLTRNEAAFVTSGAAAGVVLSAASCLCGLDEALHDRIPFAGDFPRNRVLVFDGAFRKMIPYWRLIGMSGAEIVPVEPTVEAMIRAADDRCAAAFLFAGSLYERDVPPCEEAVPRLKAAGLTVVVDAAAQLPPASNLWHYTAELGADLAVFSGGKHIRGPSPPGSSSGLKGSGGGLPHERLPQPRVGRAFKTARRSWPASSRRWSFLWPTRGAIAASRRCSRRSGMISPRRASARSWFPRGRLGTSTAAHCLAARWAVRKGGERLYPRPEAAVDVGVYPPEFGMPENAMFLNAYNLSPDQVGEVGRAVREAVGVLRKR